MTKRDTIIIAVLINMGVLLVLCIGALKPNASLETSSRKLAQAEEIIQKKGQSKKEPIDPVDSILSQYIESEKNTLAQAVPKIEIPISREEPAPVEVKPTAIIREPVEQYKEIIVQQGDVLDKIARMHGTTVDEIMRVNHLPSSRLQIGQILAIPQGRGGSKSESLSRTPCNLDKSVEEVKYYVVKTGDNPWTIATKNGIKVDDLLRLNQLNEDKAKRLKPGDRLRIR